MFRNEREKMLDRIMLFSDSKVIAMELAIIAEDMDAEDSREYWLKEAEVHILGLHELVMDLYKHLKQEEAEKQYAVQE